jgi:heme a synthase
MGSWRLPSALIAKRKAEASGATACHACITLERWGDVMQLLRIQRQGFAMTTIQSEITHRQEHEMTNRKSVLGWLYICLLVIFALVLVGGATRLTDSGLSITEWKPIHGIIPPLNDAQWQEEFAKYKLIPEFSQINNDMTIDGFKTIFWWEWGHRVLARATGLVFAIPLAFFWITGRLERKLKPRLLGILALGSMQGFVGWWMVYSGLSERTDVSQYRLAAHLTLAALIFASTAYVARGMAVHTEALANTATRRFAGFMVFAVLLQIYLGALVAGLDAGLAYNTWPLMDGAIIPSNLLGMEPIWRNFFESAKTVQFIHRCGAYAVLALAMLHMLVTVRTLPGSTHARRSILLFLLIISQAIIGVVTLVGNVEFYTALMHQGAAFIVLFFAVAHWRAAKGSYTLPTEISVRT